MLDGPTTIPLDISDNTLLRTEVRGEPVEVGVTMPVGAITIPEPEPEPEDEELAAALPVALLVALPVALPETLPGTLPVALPATLPVTLPVTLTVPLEVPLEVAVLLVPSVPTSVVLAELVPDVAADVAAEMLPVDRLVVPTESWLVVEVAAVASVVLVDPIEIEIPIPIPGELASTVEPPVAEAVKLVTEPVPEVAVVSTELVIVPEGETVASVELALSDIVPDKT